LYAVSCASARTCIATGGYFYGGLPTDRTLAERWTATKP
jgi:hypothetical protein